MQLTAAVLFVMAAAAVRGEDECAPPKPGEKHVHAGECCKMDSILPESFKEGIKTCMDKYGKPQKPPAPGAKPDAAMMNEHACMAECVFAESKLLTSDKKLDKDAITEMVTSSATADMKPVVTAAINKCIDVEVNPLITKCTSGAAEFEHCVKREVFLNCPSSLLTSNADCDGLKAQVTKCPMIPIMLGKPMGPPPK